MRKADFLMSLVPQCGDPQELFLRPERLAKLPSETLAELANEERLARVEMMKQVAERAERENVSLETLLPEPKFIGLGNKSAAKFGRLAESLTLSSMTMGDDSWD